MKQPAHPGPRILLLDIETSMSLGYFFDLWKEGNIVATLEDWFLLSFSYNWLDEKRIYTKALCDYPLYKTNKKNDRALVQDLWNVLDEADIVVAHNGDRFDLRKTNARFLAHGMRPPRPYKSVDTLKIARRHFKFDSNRLDDLGAYLGVGRKLPHTGKHLWLGCMNGDPKAWAVMKRYNPRDIKLLKDVYLLLRPWAKTHPDLNHYTRADACPKCQSHNIQQRGFNVSKAGRQQRFQCQGCGNWFSLGKTIKDAA